MDEICGFVKVSPGPTSFFFHIFLSPSPGDLTSIEFLGTRFVDLLKFHKTKLVFLFDIFSSPSPGDLTSIEFFLDEIC